MATIAPPTFVQASPPLSSCTSTYAHRTSATSLPHPSSGNSKAAAFPKHFSVLNWPSGAAHTTLSNAGSSVSKGWRYGCQAAPGDGEPPVGSSVSEVEGKESEQKEEGGIMVRRKRGEARGGDSTDWITSGLTRRFGLGAGLAWVGVLAFGVISEQIKTRTEVFREEQGTRDVESGTEVVLPNNIRFIELREGGGAYPKRGDLVLIDLTGKVVGTGDVFVDTTAKGRRSLAFVFGAKPYAGGISDGLEYAIRSMKVGGRRRVIVPPEAGFGEAGTVLSSGVKIPGQATLEYVVQLQRASIAPS